MTPVKKTTVKSRSANADDGILNWSAVDTWKIEMKYKGYVGTEQIKDKIFFYEADALKEKERLIKKIHKEGGMNLTYKDGAIREMFIFASQFNNITAQIVIATERVVNVKNLLT